MLAAAAVSAAVETVVATATVVVTVAVTGTAADTASVIVVVIALLVDNILDNILVPKVMSNALRVHPAAVLLGTLIGAQLLGVVGVILAAPVLASLQLIFRYLLRKLTDSNPWEDIDNKQPIKRSRFWIWFGSLLNHFKNWLKHLFQKKAKKNKTLASIEKPKAK